MDTALDLDLEGTRVDELADALAALGFVEVALKPPAGPISGAPSADQMAIVVYHHDGVITAMDTGRGGTGRMSRRITVIFTMLAALTAVSLFMVTAT